LLSGSFDKSSSHFAGFVTALLLAVHPFNVEAVAWLSASKVVLYAVFYFSALTAYMHYINSGKLKYYCFSLCLFIVSFGAKEQAVVLSISVVLMDCVLNRNLKDKKIWLEKLPFFIFSIFGGLLTIQSQVKGLDEVSYHISQRIVFAAYTLTEYFTKCVAPVKLSYLYPFSSQPWEVMPLKLMIYPVAICILTILLIKFRIQKYRWPCFLLLFFVANLAVALHIISLSRFAIVADRYVYVASAAVFLGIGMLCLQLIKRYPKYRKLIIICLGIYIISLGVYAHQRTKVWLDTDSLKKELREQIQKRMTSGFPVQNNNIIITI
jgi:hypothetical protein